MADQPAKAMLVYTDDDGKRHEYDGDPSTLTFRQLWDMQKVTGLNGLTPIGDAMAEMNAQALMAYLWVHLREEDSSVQFNQMNDVRIGQIELVEVEVETPKAPTESPSETSGDETSSNVSSPSSDAISGSDPATSPI
jgi:hypothetical protein